MKHLLRTLVALGFPLVVASAVRAETMPPDVAEKVAAIGRVISTTKTDAIYAPLMEKEPYQGVKVTRDVKYGAADLNVLDVFAAEGGAAARPVLLHVHGGGFSGGNKRVGDSPFTDNIPLWAARNSMVGVNINYRLAPSVKWPSGAEDIAASLNWVKKNIASFGGDPSRIYVVGWSAGGNHVASYVAFPKFHVAPGGGISGAIFLSGTPFNLIAADAPAYKNYFGEDETTYAAMSPLPGLVKSNTPMLVAYTGFDPPFIEKSSVDLIDALCKAEKCPTKVFLKTHGHISIGYAIGTKDTELTDQILTFVKSGKPAN